VTGVQTCALPIYLLNCTKRHLSMRKISIAIVTNLSHFYKDIFQGNLMISI